MFSNSNLIRYLSVDCRRSFWHPPFCSFSGHWLFPAPGDAPARRATFPVRQRSFVLQILLHARQGQLCYYAVAFLIMLWFKFLPLHPRRFCAVRSVIVEQDIKYLLARIFSFHSDRRSGCCRAIIGGGVAEWLGRWTCNLVVPGSSPSPCHSLDLFSVAPISTSWLRCVNSQLVCLLPVGIFKHFLFISLFICIGPEKPLWGSGQLRWWWRWWLLLLLFIIIISMWINTDIYLCCTLLFVFQSVIDGDLCEYYNSLDSSKRRNIAEELDRTPAEV